MPADTPDTHGGRPGLASGTGPQIAIAACGLTAVDPGEQRSGCIASGSPR